MEPNVGTWQWMAPEVISGEYDQKVSCTGSAGLPSGVSRRGGRLFLWGPALGASDAPGPVRRPFVPVE